MDRVGKGKRVCQDCEEARGGQELRPGSGAREGLGSFKMKVEYVV